MGFYYFARKQQRAIVNSSLSWCLLSATLPAKALCMWETGCEKFACRNLSTYLMAKSMSLEQLAFWKRCSNRPYSSNCSNSALVCMVSIQFIRCILCPSICVRNAVESGHGSPEDLLWLGAKIAHLSILLYNRIIIKLRTFAWRRWRFPKRIVVFQQCLHSSFKIYLLCWHVFDSVML